MLPHGRHQLIPRGGVGRPGPEAEQEAELRDAQVGVFGQPLLLQVLQRHGGGGGGGALLRRRRRRRGPSDSAATAGSGAPLLLLLPLPAPSRGPAAPPAGSEGKEGAGGALRMRSVEGRGERGGGAVRAHSAGCRGRARTRPEGAALRGGGGGHGDGAHSPCSRLRWPPAPHPSAPALPLPHGASGVWK